MGNSGGGTIPERGRNDLLADCKLACEGKFPSFTVLCSGNFLSLSEGIDSEFGQQEETIIVDTIASCAPMHGVQGATF